MTRLLDHLTCHVEHWEGSDPIGTWTVHWQDGTYTVLPPVAIGPFDTYDDVVRSAKEAVDLQLSLW